MSPSAPWTCRVRAVNRLAVSRRGVTLFALVDYLDTPVGPYREALVADLRGPWGTVPWIVVDSVASLEAGRSLWCLPKQLGTLRFAPEFRTASVSAGSVHAEVSARPAPARLPVVVPGWLTQPGRPRARVRFRGRMRPAMVQVTGALPLGLSLGAGPGALLDGELWIGPAA